MAWRGLHPFPGSAGRPLRQKGLVEMFDSSIGAGSVLRTDAEPYGVYAGVPARKIRDLRTGERCEK